MKPTIIVCGDIMLDHNIYTRLEKIANEAPIPVYNRLSEEWRLGGCGNVLKNLQSLGCTKLYAFGAIGNDSNGEKINTLVSEIGIQNCIITIPSYNTITKQRYFCDNRIMFRCDIENTSDQKNLLLSIIFTDEIEKILVREKVDCIILSDYNKGVLTKSQCQSIIQLANRYGVMTCVDPKEDPTKYIGCTLIKPNRSEAHKLFHMPQKAPIADLHKVIRDVIGCRYSVITLAEQGITLFDGVTLFHERAVARNIIDVTGAGDVVCSVLSYFIHSISSLSELLRLATHLATKSVETPGTYTVTSADLIELSGKQITFESLRLIPREGKKLVFTNGCFDLLHSGHLELLRFCKKNGDIIVVGVNSDVSVRGLKGPTRPVQSETVRIDVLSALEYVDYIILFEDATPYRILKELKPDLLVKGGDYCIEAIIGREFAKDTIVCPLVEGISTTRLIEKINTP
jgi:D-beta-D-heptose 7-phosphate kinase/D-beta-D-heptose 1-phosphate adenosyltransferase